MDDGRAKQLQVYAEDKIQVLDHGRSATPFPRALSQYLSADISARLVNPGAPRPPEIIDREIMSVDAIINSLQVLRILKSQTRNGCVPISRLPPEILSEIFVICSLDCRNSEDNDATGLHKLDLRLILGQVCSAWRSVAWGLPMLWTTVHCRIPHPNKSKKLAGLLFQWLLRAQGLPVSAKIDFLDEEAWARLGVNAPIDVLDALMAFYHKLKVLDLVLPASWQDHLNTVNPLHLNSLEELQIRPPAPYQYHEVKIDAFFYSPKLCSVSYQSYLLQHLQLPWMNLTHATFGGPSFDEVIELLSLCTDLVICCISDPTPDDQIYPVSAVVHNCLQELRIEFCTTGPTLPVAMDILGFLTAPHLRNLSLTLPLNHTSPLPNILELVERSQCPLRELEIYGPGLGQDQVIDFLSESSVAHLHNG